MNKETRTAIERATQRARKLLEEDFGAQLEGDFDVFLSKGGEVAASASVHLTARQAFSRERIVSVIEHKRAAGMSAEGAARDYLRDAAFTTLNRFVALKMLEARELVQECITRGEQSTGYREYCGLAAGLPLLPKSAGYRLYIESIFDELSTEVKVLFDRRDPSSVLWPTRTTFEQLLELLNDPALAGAWGEDETIGWVYQYFNGKEERAAMREASQAPRNSRELAVRNQFFTPRYVVQFLTDNTLGRIWYEMRRGKTRLAETCEYMVRKPGEEIAPRAKKDPRDLRILDPACGSGHFLLYAFDLLLPIYEEAFEDSESPRSEATGRTLAEDYPSIDALRAALPGLVMTHNLHGVDIDPRCAQIAQLALWIRAQKAFRDFAIRRTERTRIHRSNIVVAEPLVADDQIVKEFVAKLGDAVLGRMFMSLVESLSLAGDLGLLLRVEQLVTRQVKHGQTSELFAAPEARIRAVLDRFVREAGAANTRRRLFAGDAVQGVALLGVAEKRFDVVLMNPPFGQAVEGVFAKLVNDYPGAHHDIYATFVSRAAELAPQGAVGCISSRAFLVTTRLEEFRRELVLPSLVLLADLGPNVMDNASVEAAAYVLRMPSANMDTFSVISRDGLPGLTSQGAISHDLRRAAFEELPFAKILHGLSSDFLELLRATLPFEGTVGTAREGMKSFDNFRFVRLWWEVCSDSIGVGAEFVWTRFAKGGGHVEWLMPSDLVINWRANGRELQDINFQLNGSTAQVRQASAYWFKRGATYSRRSVRFAVRALPDEHIFSTEGPAVLLEPAAGNVTNEYLLGWLNSRLCRLLVEIQANKQKYLTGIIKRLPWRAPPAEVAVVVRKAVAGALSARWYMHALSEVAPQYSGIPDGADTESRCLTAEQIIATAQGRTRECVDVCDDNIDRLYGVDSSTVAVLVGDVGDVGDGDDESVDADDEGDASQSALATFERDDLTSWLVGVAFGRFDPRLATGERPILSEPEPFAPLPSRSPGMYPEGEEPADRPGVLVDDEGHADDLAARAIAVAERVKVDVPENLRAWLAREFFPFHIKMYSKSRRKAPIYWQLATPSASYSVWLYIHAFGKDTLFRVQNDYVAPKLAHEERRLEALTREARDGATGAQRKELAAQEALVEELRAFLAEVKLVAPLWNPDLDDGVILNFAPLWRLVPQNKVWQKEAKAAWDALNNAKYDWAHLAMHLWPERVVPKCAADRSLAIAHGLEDVFWIEGRDGKWKAREAPTRSVAGLVKERTSPAVKAALKSLLEAPVASGKTGARKAPARRKAAAKAGGA